MNLLCSGPAFLWSSSSGIWSGDGQCLQVTDVYDGDHIGGDHHAGYYGDKYDDFKLEMIIIVIIMMVKLIAAKSLPLRLLLLVMPLLRSGLKWEWVP